ncbi:hypothetical protein QQG55_12535 [Brugia pahangi]
MLRDLFYQLFPGATVQQIFHNIQNLKQQIISAQVRLVILNDANLEEKHLVLTRIAALQAELEQQIFFFVVATRNDEVPIYRNWLEKQDTTNGPLYVRTFKRWQDEQHWRPSLSYPPYLQNRSTFPLYLRYPPLAPPLLSLLPPPSLLPALPPQQPLSVLPALPQLPPVPPPRIFFDDLQSRPGISYRFSDREALRNFNIPFLFKPTSIVYPNVIDCNLPIQLKLSELSADFKRQLQLPSSENESSDET